MGEYMGSCKMGQCLDKVAGCYDANFRHSSHLGTEQRRLSTVSRRTTSTNRSSDESMHVTRSSKSWGNSSPQADQEKRRMTRQRRHSMPHGTWGENREYQGHWI